MDLSLKTILDELMTRIATGPFQFRFILQPAMATLLGVRDGLADAKSGSPPFLWGLLSRRIASKGQFKTALRHLMVPVVIATVLDAVVQYLTFSHIRPLTALIVGTILMSLPYTTARGVANRLRSRRDTARKQRAKQGAQPVPHYLDRHSK